jgi:drug/metabolite transporter (DMT)-like permease
MGPLSDERRGAFLLILSAFGFSAMSVLVKLGGKELPVAMLVLARGFFSLVLSYAWLRARGIPSWGTNHRGLVLRALFGVGGLACFFYAVTVLPLAEVTVIHYLNPIFTAIIATFLLGERADRRLIFAIVLALAGTVLVTRPGVMFGVHTALSLPGVLAALGGAIFSACAYSTVRRLTVTEHPDVIVFYFSLIATPLAIPFAAASWVAPTLRGWLILIGIGVAVQVGQVFLTRGLAIVPAARGTTITYIQIVFAAFWGWVLFNEPPNVWTFVGALLVVVAVVLLLGLPSLARDKPDDHPTAHADRAPAERTERSS